MYVAPKSADWKTSACQLVTATRRISLSSANFVIRLEAGDSRSLQPDTAPIEPRCRRIGVLAYGTNQLAQTIPGDCCCGLTGRQTDFRYPGEAAVGRMVQAAGTS